MCGFVSAITNPVAGALGLGSSGGGGGGGPFGGAFGGDIVGEITGSNAAEAAAQAVNRATGQAVARQEQALDFQEQAFGRSEDVLRGLQQQTAPFRQAGLAAIGQARDIVQNPQTLAQNPQLQFLQQQGRQAVDRSASARGMNLSGRTLKDLQRFGQGTAQQFRSQILSDLSSLGRLGAGVGFQASSGLANLPIQEAQMRTSTLGDIGNLLQQKGATKASAEIGAFRGFADILSGGLQAVGSLAGASSREIKHSIEPADPFDLDNLEVYRWKYIGSNEPHVGPMAEDFKETTGLGDGKSINLLDAFGTLLLEVKSLRNRVRELEETPGGSSDHPGGSDDAN